MGPRGSYPWKPLSYPWTTYTSVLGTMVVPGYPTTTQDITYYIWTDLQFGDAGLGRMNQFVPQLILGEALDGSSGVPYYKPKWGEHNTWMFGAHYFFQVYTNESRTDYEAHAAYGELHPASPGEMLFTQFIASGPLEAPVWTLTMGVVGDSTRVSSIEVVQPYMGLGAHWKEPSISWAEVEYTNMSSHSCWELYGTNDLAHFPSTGTTYTITIFPSDGAPTSPFPWVSEWYSGGHEGPGTQSPCGTGNVSEEHSNEFQRVTWQIGVKKMTKDGSATVAK